MCLPLHRSNLEQWLPKWPQWPQWRKLRKLQRQMLQTKFLLLLLPVALPPQEMVAMEPLAPVVADPLAVDLSAVEPSVAACPTTSGKHNAPSN